MWAQSGQNWHVKAAPTLIAAGLHIAGISVAIGLSGTNRAPLPVPVVTVLSLKNIEIAPEPPPPPPEEAQTPQANHTEAGKAKPATGKPARQEKSDDGVQPQPKADLPKVSNDLANQMASNPLTLPLSISESPELEAAQKTLEALKCLQLGEDKRDPLCAGFAARYSLGNEALSLPGWSPVEIGPNPFASALDAFADKQFVDRSTPYSLSQSKAANHQHANPFAGTQSSAERDLTGRVNASPDPIWND